MKNIIFLLGLPRSGSTLLQRMLSAHEEITSIAEPWLLLPLITSFDPENNLSTYSHLALKKAIDDLSIEYPNLDDDYHNFVKKFTFHVYGQLALNQKYFLDKTPRYYLIASKLRKVFDEAKFVYIFRNPVDIIDSVINTFCSNRIFRLPYYYYDLTEGLNLLNQSLIFESNNQLLIRYEDLCDYPEKEIEKVFSFLEIEQDLAVIDSFKSIEFKGIYGDPNRNMHSKVVNHKSTIPLSYIRKRLYKNIIDNFNDNALNNTGYLKSDLISEVQSRKSANIKMQFMDLIDYIIFKISMIIGFPLISRLSGKKRFSINQFMS